MVTHVTVVVTNVVVVTVTGVAIVVVDVMVENIVEAKVKVTVVTKSVTVVVVVVPKLPVPAAANSLTEKDAITGTAKLAPSTSFFSVERFSGSTFCRTCSSFSSFI